MIETAEQFGGFLYPKTADTPSFRAGGHYFLST